MVDCSVVGWSTPNPFVGWSMVDLASRISKKANNSAASLWRLSRSFSLNEQKGLDKETTTNMSFCFKNIQLVSWVKVLHGITDSIEIGIEAILIAISLHRVCFFFEYVRLTGKPSKSWRSRTFHAYPAVVWCPRISGYDFSMWIDTLSASCQDDGWVWAASWTLVLTSRGHCLGPAGFHGKLCKQKQKKQIQTTNINKSKGQLHEDVEFRVPPIYEFTCCHVWIFIREKQG